ncbi:MAG: hypothetical protein M5U26_19565 [Planctomycetota bacterium]|nr:hypothetical protein [Planctomycetota bacterium]
MPRRRAKPAKSKLPRGRKPIFTPEQKRVLERLIREALKAELGRLVRGL